MFNRYRFLLEQWANFYFLRFELKTIVAFNYIDHSKSIHRIQMYVSNHVHACLGT